MSNEVNKKESNRMLIISLAVIAIFVAALFTNGFGLASLFEKRVTVEIGNAPVLGDLSAPVTIFEFSDFSCPYCAAADGKTNEATQSLFESDPNWVAPIPNIINDYVKTGKAKIVFKYFQGHTARAKAHQVAWCLNDQGKFWEFHDLAFANQQDANNLTALRSLAQSIGADLTKLDDCIDSGKYNSQFGIDQKEGNDAGIKGTPTFVINGILVEGAKSYPEFKKIIDKEL